MDKYDLFALLGLGLIATGLAFVYWPLALIVPGVLLLTLGVVGAVRRGPPSSEDEVTTE